VLGQRRSRRIGVVRFGVGMALLAPDEDDAAVADALARGKG
jgi:hypothetical protein